MKILATRAAMAAIMVGGLCGGAAYAAGTIPGTDGIIHGCYRTSDGRLRVIDPARTACRRDEAPIQWNERGPRGQRGNAGPPGPAGNVASLRTIVAALQTQVADLQARVANLETPTATPQPTATPTPQPTATQTPTPTTVSSQAPVSIQNFAFGSGSITVKVGTTVTWTNRDSVAHTVTADNGSFDSGLLMPNQTFSHTFNAPGTVTYHCSIHPDMVGTVIVTP